jgi:hypothetical protein
MCWSCMTVHLPAANLLPTSLPANITPTQSTHYLLKSHRVQITYTNTEPCAASIHINARQLVTSHWCTSDPQVLAHSTVECTPKPIRVTHVHTQKLTPPTSVTNRGTLTPHVREPKSTCHPTSPSGSGSACCRSADHMIRNVIWFMYALPVASVRRMEFFCSASGEFWK